MDNDALHNEISDAVDASLRQWIDQRAKILHEKRLLAAVVGKSLVLLGSSFIGASADLTADVSLGLAINLLDSFRELMRERKTDG